ncbi:hypothetical protein DFH06DRAFT_1215097 [Mycena polygramma]|nr:hypothetical protein DFH06DRAFT_1215097 [Mycena polygramma]
MSAPYAHRSSGPPPPYDSGPFQGAGRPAAHAPRGAISAFPSEHTPLRPSATLSNDIDTNPEKRFKNGILSLVVLVGFMIIMTLIVSRDDALDPAARDRIHREWDKEMRDHEAMRDAWAVERVGWENERHDVIAMREQLVRDKEQWARDSEETRREDETHRSEEDERRRKEDEGVCSGAAWDRLRGDEHCSQHGTRRYTARLANVPRGYDPVKACTETAVEIHGLKIPSPNHCEDRGCGGVIGHWLVNYSEPRCVTRFDYFKDKGCTYRGSGLRRIESHLENLQGGDDWHEMCSTTPADFRQLHFEGPDICENWGEYGVWGIWNIEDHYC